MAKHYSAIDAGIQAFIEQQQVFFVGTAAADGRVNVSPKGQDTLRVLDANRAAWLDLTGSGNETAAHLHKLNRITLMRCAFEGRPTILRLYGTATVYHPRDAAWADLLPLFPPLPGAQRPQPRWHAHVHLSAALSPLSKPNNSPRSNWFR